MDMTTISSVWLFPFEEITQSEDGEDLISEYWINLYDIQLIKFCIDEEGCHYAIIDLKKTKTRHFIYGGDFSRLVSDLETIRARQLANPKITVTQELA